MRRVSQAPASRGGGGGAGGAAASTTPVVLPRGRAIIAPYSRRAVYFILLVLSALSLLVSLRRGAHYMHFSPDPATLSSLLLLVPYQARQTPPTAANGELLHDGKSVCDMTSDELEQRRDKYLPRIWQFWEGEGKEMPGYLSLCHDLMVVMNPTIVVDVVNADCVKRVFNDTPPNFDYLIPAHKADYARCRLLDRYGGMYNDLDTITLNSLQPLFDKLDAEHDIVRGLGGPEYSTATSGNLGPMKPGLPGMRGCSDIWHEQMMAGKVSKEHGDQLIWTMNDGTILLPMDKISRSDPASIRFYDLEPFDSANLAGSYIWYAFHDKIQNHRVAAYVRDGNFTGNQFLLVLSNRNISPEYKMYSREQAYCSKNKISEMLRAQLARAGRPAVVDSCDQVSMPNKMLELEFESVPNERTTQLKFATSQGAVSGSMRQHKLMGK